MAGSVVSRCQARTNASAQGQECSIRSRLAAGTETVKAQGKVIQRSVYDGFDHVVESQQMDDTGALKSTKYSFDPLDRTTSKTADGKTTDYEYLGMSEQVLDEKVGSQLTKSYQYSPWGERLSQIKHNADGTTEDGYYGYNSHTDVETLTDSNGDTKATYGYTAYGSDDTTEFTGIDKPDTVNSTKDAYNPYRFNAKRWDAQSGTYDMGFRDYNPGLNRFTTRDMYNGALADMDLGADPYTGNRYAFTGGNPTSRAEYDGHTSCDITGMCGGTYRETSVIKAEQRQSPAKSYQAVEDFMFAEMKGNLETDVFKFMKDNIESCDTSNPIRYAFGCEPDAATTMWIAQVQTGSEWDHKGILREQLPVEKRDGICCYNKIPGMDADVYYDVWSNVHYGYVGAATGLDQDFLEFGASPGLDIPGVKSLPLVGASDPGDEATVRMGVDLWNTYGADLTQEQFHSELLKMFGDLQGTDKISGVPSSMTPQPWDKVPGGWN